MHRLEQMRECLIACVQNQISGHLDRVDTKELGEAIDMIKDLDEAIYYRTITEAMKEDSEEKEKQHWGSHEPKYYEPMYNNNGKTGKAYYSDMRMGDHPRDMREGQSPMYRKMYMEAKEQHHDSAQQMKELENYMHELTNDVMELLNDATTEEKQLLRQKLTALAAKIK